jgi:hypothetical protein
MEVGGQLHSPAPLPSGKDPSVLIRLESAWAPEPVSTLWNSRESNPGHPTRSPSPYRHFIGTKSFSVASDLATALSSVLSAHVRQMSQVVN